MSAIKALEPMWYWAVGATLLAVLAGFLFFEYQEVIGIALGAAVAFVHLFMLKRMAARALAQNSPGKSLIFIIFLKSGLRFLLTGLFLAILFYLGWLKPSGFVIGFTMVMAAVFAWGCSRVLRHNPQNRGTG